MPSRIKHMNIWFGLLILIASFAAYSNSLTNGFAYDDITIVVGNPNIRNLSNLVSSLDLYRPMRWLTFALDYRFWKLDPTGYHLTNLFLHVACALLVFSVAKLLIKDPLGAFIASLIFCIHPITTEAVDNISNRNELLGTAFSLAAFYFYIRKHESPRYLIVAVPLHFLALLSKEAIAISLPLLYVAYDLYFTRTRDGRMSFSGLAPGFAFLTISILAIGYGVSVLHIGSRIRDTFLYLSANTFVDSNPILIAINIWVRAMAKGLLLILYPRTLSADYPVPHIESLADGTFIGSVVVLFISIVAISLVSRRSRIASFGLLWVIIFLLPASNIIPITQHYMAERYLYAPLIGLCIFAGMTLGAIYRGKPQLMEGAAQRKTALLILAIIVVLFVRMDLRRNRDWRSDYAIWTATAVQCPKSPVARINIGMHLQSSGRIDDAIEQYRKTIAIYDAYNIELPGNNRKGRRPSAMIASQYASAHNDIGCSYMALDMHEKAIPELKKAVAVSPHHYLAYYNLGIAYIHEGEIDAALDALERSVRIYDNYAEAHRALSVVYDEKGLSVAAKREYAKAMMLKEKSTPK